jgi:hypothetical protein
MLTPRNWRGETCSSRCDQRWRRHRKRQKTSYCVQCNEEFATTRADAKYCSNACRQRAHRALAGCSGSRVRPG